LAIGWFVIIALFLETFLGVYFINWLKEVLYEKLKNGKYVDLATYIPSIISAIHVFIS